MISQGPASSILFRWDHGDLAVEKWRGGDLVWGFIVPRRDVFKQGGLMQMILEEKDRELGTKDRRAP